MSSFMKTPPPGPALALRRAAALLGLALLALAGCEKEPVRTQTIDQPRLRLLAAVVRHGKETWAFKFVGRATPVTEHKKEFDAFVRSVRFIDDDEEKPIEWQAPEGWREQEGKGAVYATFVVAAGDPPAEVQVLRLGPKASVYDLLNRWRRHDLGAGPLRRGDVEEFAKPGDDLAGHLVTR